jgi:hypothetical protein
MRRDQLLWGSGLLLIGILMLANAMGIRLPNGNSLTSLFWPVALLLLGAWLLVGAFVRRNVESQSASIELQGATEARLQMNHGAGEFRLHGGANANEFTRGTFVGGVEQKVTRNGDRLEVRMRPAKDFIDFPFFGPHSQLDWDVALNSSIPTALEMHLGANKSTMDLRDLNITDLTLKSGASDTTLTLPATGRLNADFEIGAASLTLIVPDGVSIRVRASLGAGDLNVDRARFPSNESTDFATAPNAVDINIKGGACSVKVK